MITPPVLLLLLTAQTAPPPPPPPSNSGTEQVIGPDKGGVDDALGRAATRPLRDLNVMKPKIEQTVGHGLAVLRQKHKFTWQSMHRYFF